MNAYFGPILLAPPPTAQLASSRLRDGPAPQFSIEPRHFKQEVEDGLYFARQVFLVRIENRDRHTVDLVVLEQTDKRTAFEIPAEKPPCGLGYAEARCRRLAQNVAAVNPDGAVDIDGDGLAFVALELPARAEFTDDAGVMGEFVPASGALPNRSQILRRCGGHQRHADQHATNDRRIVELARQDGKVEPFCNQICRNRR